MGVAGEGAFCGDGERRRGDGGGKVCGVDWEEGEGGEGGGGVVEGV